MIKYCELDKNKVCNNCNECNICDLDPNKICDSCGKCIDESGSDYLEVILDGILEDETEVQDYVDNDILNAGDKDDEDLLDMDYLEDIPNLKAEYDKKINAILKGEGGVEEHRHKH